MHHIKYRVISSWKRREGVVRAEVHILRQPFLGWELRKGDIEAVDTACTLELGRQTNGVDAMSGSAKVEAGMWKGQYLRVPSANVCNAKASIVSGNGGMDKVAGELGVQPVVVAQTGERKLVIVGFCAGPKGGHRAIER